MAWDNYKVGDLKLISGDLVFDHLRDAVRRIREHYLERFGRNPYLSELVYTLFRIANSKSLRVVEDSTFPRVADLLSSLISPTSSDQIDPGKYEAGWNESAELLIWPITKGSGASSDAPVLRMEVEDNRPEEVVCRYTLIGSGISDAAAACLIRWCALMRLLKYDLLDPELVVRFEKQ
jgi:hypothetical protein